MWKAPTACYNLPSRSRKGPLFRLSSPNLILDHACSGEGNAGSDLASSASRQDLRPCSQTSHGLTPWGHLCCPRPEATGKGNSESLKPRIT
ncbi:mCG147824 [Mus musculus]|nr:mCG147824 [Mus musculus]